MEPGAAPAEAPRAGWFAGWARSLLLRWFAGLKDGRLTVEEAAGRQQFGAGGDLTAAIRVRHPRLYGRLLRGGSLGAAEAYLDGDWEADDLPAALRIFLRNPGVMHGLDRGWARLTGALRWISRRLRVNTRAGSRRNVAAHYDLGNDFFALFLDPSLMYSAALFERPEATLEEASAAKLDRLCRKLDLVPADHLLEIGSGWGGMAIHAARRYGCRVTTTTVSRAQFELARRRVAEAGLADRVTVLLEDYRDLRGTYDKLVSIEMIEAVGHEYLGTYFRQCGRLLKDDGLMALQAITIPDQYHEAHRRSADFIQLYVFPGSHLPSVTTMCHAMTDRSDLRLTHLEDLTPHYARTLAHWRRRFHANLDQVRQLGYPERFVRLWDYYLAYTEAGFAERYLGSVQMLLAKPGCRRAPVLGELRADPC